MYPSVPVFLYITQKSLFHLSRSKISKEFKILIYLFEKKMSWKKFLHLVIILDVYYFTVVHFAKSSMCLSGRLITLLFKWRLFAVCEFLYYCYFYYYYYYLLQGSDMAYLSNLHSEFDSSPDYVKVRCYWISGKI
jgi:hypothetical protein